MSITTSSKQSQFAHFMLHKVRETRFRMTELLDVCESSRQNFILKKPTSDGEGARVNYHFAALSSLIQTLKDVLPVMSGEAVTWSSLSAVRHIVFMRAVRNAITHDGNPVINLWVDGRFYVACDFLRIDQHGAKVLVTAPADDLAKVSLEFAIDLSDQLRTHIEPLIGRAALTAPMYGVEFFAKASQHPAIPAFAEPLLSEFDWSAIPAQTKDTASEIIAELLGLHVDSTARLARIAA
jgi:hypothetical protein